LNGLSLPPSPTLPNLCGAITGSVSGIAAGANGGNLPYNNLCTLQSIDVEVSDVDGDLVPDITAYAHGNVGDQFIEVFITALDGADTDFDFDTAPPWFKIGLYTDLINAGDSETTPICAQVSSFSGVSTLTISNDALPNTIAFSGDNEIGHFLAQSVTLNDCTKEDMASDTCVDTETIDNCPLGGTVQAPACPSYFKCFVMEGDLPTTGDMRINIRTNGAATGDNTQEGIYIKNIVMHTENGVVIPVAYTGYTADGNPAVAPCTAWELEWAQATIPSGVTQLIAAAGNEIRFCIEYTANPDEVQVGTDVLFWVSATEQPCGSIVSGTVTGANIVECALGGGSSMYFPYVLTASAPWTTGIVVTNLGSAVAPADMDVTFTLTDSTGAVFTYARQGCPATVWAFFLDDIVAEFGAPAAGAAWLQVDANFPMDGYEFLTDGTFGAGTLPRLIP